MLKWIENRSTVPVSNVIIMKACGSSVSLRYGTAYMRLEADPAIFETVVRALAEGNSLHATAQIVQIDTGCRLNFLIGCLI